MTKKKTTNKVAYHIEKLKKYIKGIEDSLDKQNPENFSDRVDVQYNARTGMPVTKTIASIETQHKSFMDRVKLLPDLISQLNRLLLEVEGTEETSDPQSRGGVAIPGIFKKRMLERSVEKEETENDKTEDDTKSSFNSAVEDIQEIAEKEIQDGYGEYDDDWEED